jgi:hypothetical protein
LRYVKDPDRPPTLRVNYYIGDATNLFSQTIVSEWLAFEAFGVAFTKAANYWHRAWDADFGQPIIPQSVAEALDHVNLVGSIRPPKRIATKPNPSAPKYLQVTNYEF